MEQILNLDVIKRQLDNSEIYYDTDNDSLYQSTYLGSVFNIMPSGKYYMLFACSNVTEDEAEEDERYNAQMEDELRTINAYLISGEGDPTDILINRTYAILDEIPTCDIDKYCSIEFIEVTEDNQFALFKCKHHEYKIKITLENI